MKANSHIVSVVKAFSWRTFAGADTFILSFIMTGSFKMAGSIMGFEILTKSFLFYVHERAWWKVTQLKMEAHHV